MARRLHRGWRIMKASKFIVLVGGILGILAFFLPMVTVEREGAKASVSAFQIIKGLDEVSAQVDGQDVKVALASAGGSAAEAKEGLAPMKGIVMAIFAPALLLVLIGGLAVKNRKFGRGAGVLVLLFGLIGLGIGSILFSAAGSDGGIALTLLLVTGVAGVVGGFLARIQPERALAAA